MNIYIYTHIHYIYRHTPDRVSHHRLRNRVGETTRN